MYRLHILVINYKIDKKEQTVISRVCTTNNNKNLIWNQLKATKSQIWILHDVVAKGKAQVYNQIYVQHRNCKTRLGDKVN